MSGQDQYGPGDPRNGDGMHESADLDGGGAVKARTSSARPPWRDEADDVPSPSGPFDFKARWAALSSLQKLRARQAAIAGVVALVGWGLYTASSSGDAPAVQAPTASKLDMGAGLRGDSLETKLRGDLKKVLDGQDLLGERITAIEEGKIGPGSRAGGSADARGDEGELPSALPGSPPTLPPPPSDTDLAGTAGSIPPPPVPSAPPAPPAPPTQKTVGAIGSAAAALAPAAGESGPTSKKTYGPPRLQGGF